MAVLIPIYLIGGLASVLFLLFMEQWHRAERLQRELDGLKNELEVAATALTQVEKQVDDIVVPH